MILFKKKTVVYHVLCCRDLKCNIQSMYEPIVHVCVSILGWGTYWPFPCTSHDPMHCVVYQHHLLHWHSIRINNAFVLIYQDVALSCGTNSYTVHELFYRVDNDAYHPKNISRSTWSALISIQSVWKSRWQMICRRVGMWVCRHTAREIYNSNAHIFTETKKKEKKTKHEKWEWRPHSIHHSCLRWSNRENKDLNNSLTNDS